jgi:hypothetical protein
VSRDNMQDNKSKPITPIEVVSLKETLIPNEVFDAFNELIAKKWNGRSATIKQNEVVKLITGKMQLQDDSILYDNHWLDIETVYREAGWVVSYDKPAYNESYEATFKFESKR